MLHISHSAIPATVMKATLTGIMNVYHALTPYVVHVTRESAHYASQEAAWLMVYVSAMLGHTIRTELVCHAMTYVRYVTLKRAA
jgi:hypothetical protein